MSRDRALGALLGSFIGESAGALLEIPYKTSVDVERVEWALTHPGGGALRLGPSQVADGSEMATANALGLATAAPPHWPADEVATWYAQWLESRPFAIGKGCRAPCEAALRALRSGGHDSPAITMAVEAAAANAGLQSNGALRRAAPLALWGHALDEAQLALCAEQDANLTHPHANCRACNAIFVIALARLVRSPGDAEAALQAAAAYARSHAPAEVRAWLAEALGPAPLPSVSAGGGADWVRWPFSCAFRHLKLRSGYETAMRDVLSLGGAIGANAAAVGAFAGALSGAAAIPASLQEPVLKRGPLAVGAPKRPRPPWLHSRQLPALCLQLLSAGAGASCMEILTPDKMASR